MKKIIAFMLSFALLITSVCCVAPLSSAAQEGIDVPLIYIEGQGASLYRNYGTPEQEQIYPIQVPEGYIEEKVDQYFPVFAEAFFTQKWDDFCVALHDSLVPLFEDVRLDNNGEPSDGSTVGWRWSEATLTDKKVNGKYQIDDYVFKYDWRLDPWETADELHAYIEAVRKVTGEEDVALIGRCLGACIAAAYMTKYDGEYVKECIFYASASHGAAMASKMFAGELYLEADGIERYVYDIQLFEEDYLEQLLESLVTMLNETYGLDIACWAVNNVYEDIVYDVMPPIMSETFATYPGYWSMVTEGDFEKAKDVCFYQMEDEYAGLIAKIDNYHVNTRLKMDEKYIELSNEGVEFSNVAKYGLQIIPVSNENDSVSDGTCEISQSSMGATAAGVESVFDDEYIENAKNNGTFKYISPDGQIDASTCLFPESTWFIKGLKHDHFPDYIENIFTEIINNDGYTVFDNPEYPQYLVYEKDTDIVVPMIEKNMNTTAHWDVSFSDALVTFVKSLFTIIKNYFEPIK